uniref:Transmembrane protein n=1 Tax=Heterorhabditis bacteriophora TaxID=37862 RepID=A0A1I7X8P6_HETBA
MRRAVADKLFRFRRARHTSNDTDSNTDGFDYIDIEAEELSKKVSKHLWVIQENDVFAEEALDKAICIRTIFILSTIVLVCTSIVILLVAFLQRRRKSEGVMPNPQNSTVNITALRC